MSRMHLAPAVNMITSGVDSPLLLQEALWPSAARPAKTSLWAAEQRAGPGDLQGSLQPKLLHKSMKETLTPNQAGERWICAWAVGRQVMGDVLCVDQRPNLRGAGSSQGDAGWLRGRQQGRPARCWLLRCSGNTDFSVFCVTSRGLSQESTMDDWMNHYECVGSAFQWVRSVSLQLCLTL